jgi:hypothetical protein
MVAMAGVDGLCPSPVSRYQTAGNNGESLFSFLYLILWEFIFSLFTPLLFLSCLPFSSFFVIGPLGR